MEALFLKILNLSLQASWIVLGVILFRLIFRKAPKYIRGILWSVAALRLVLPFSIESIVSLMPSKEVIPETIVYSPNPQINSGFESVDIIINPIITETFAPNPINSVNPLQIVNFVLACLWLIGIAVFLIYGAVNYILLYKRVSVSQNIGEGVYICDKIRTPFILGIIKPKIYLPSDIKETEKGYVIAHERAHLKRLDHIFKPLGFLILAVYWFNPIIWLGYVLFCRDMELACDEKVVKDLTAEEKKSYSETLLSFGLSDGIAKTFSPAFGEIGIRARIKTVLNYKKPAFWVIIVALLLAAALAVGFLTDPISQNEETPDDTSSSVDSNGIDIIIPYKENWQEDYFTGEENKVVAVSGRNKNIKAYFVDYNIPYRYSDMIFEDGERVIIRNLKSPIYGSKIPEKIYLCDIDGDQIDEIILPDAYWVNGGYCSLVYKITDNGFEEFLNTKDISDYGYYLEPNTHNDNLVNIKNKYVNEYDYFSSLSSNKKYFYGEDGNFKTNITIEYSAITNTDFQDVNGDGILEIIIDRYAVVRGCPAAILTKTAFSYNGEKFVVIDAQYSNYYKEDMTNEYKYLGESIIQEDLPAFEEGDTVFGENFIFWFIINELYDIKNSIVTPYYQPYLDDGTVYPGTYKIPKKLVQEVIKENFAVEISSESTKYDDGDYYNISPVGFGPMVSVSLESLNKGGENMIVGYKIVSVPMVEGTPEELGEMEIAIDNDGKGKVLYFRPKYYE